MPVTGLTYLHIAGAGSVLKVSQFSVRQLLSKEHTRNLPPSCPISNFYFSWSLLTPPLNPFDCLLILPKPIQILLSNNTEYELAKKKSKNRNIANWEGIVDDGFTQVTLGGAYGVRSDSRI